MTLLHASSIGISFGKVEVISDLDFSLSSGELVGLIGPNGAGKTTLLRVMAGLLRPDRGDVRIVGRPLQHLGRRQIAKSLAYLPQGGESHWAVTASTLVMLGRLPHRDPWRSPSDTDWKAVDQALVACDALQFKERPVSQLSGGERARVFLARALASEPRVLLADEPVSGLDPGHQLDVMTKLRGLARSGAGIVVVMHDLTLAARFCDRIVVLHNRRMAAEGNPEDVLSPTVLDQCYGIRAFHSSAGGNTIVVPLERTLREPGHGVG